MIKKVFRVVGIAALCVVGVAVAYAAIGLALSLIPVNGNAEPGGDVVVYLRHNGFHSDIVVPTKTDRIDWTAIVPPGDTTGKVAGEYVAFGWGSQDFYLNFPDWSDVLGHPLRTLCVGPRAISGVGETALHTTYMFAPVEGDDCRRLSFSSEQYDTLVKYILESGKRNEVGCFVRIPHDGYRSNDAFYEGSGRYSPVFTCNTWVNSALKACGQKCCLWTFLPQPIFWKHR